MSHSLKILLPILLCSVVSFAQDSLVTKKYTFGGNSKEFGISATQLSSNRAILFNITKNCVTGVCQHGLGTALITDNGQIVRSNVIGHPTNDLDVLNAYPSSDGNCVSFSNSVNYSRVIQKIDTNLNILWNACIPIDPMVSEYGLFRGVAAEMDNRHHALHGNQWLTYSQTGTLVRSKRYMNGFDAENKFDLSALDKLKNNQYVLGGHICDQVGYHSDPFVMITDSLGTIINSVKYDVPEDFTNQITAMYVLSENSIVAIGNLSNGAFALGLDGNLNLKWAKKYTGANFYTHSIAKVNSNTFVYVGGGTTFAIDSLGQVSWAKIIDYGQGAKLYASDDCHFSLYSTKKINNIGKGQWIKMDYLGNYSNNLTTNYSVTATDLVISTATPNISDLGTIVTTPFSVPFTVAPPITLTDSLISIAPSTANCAFSVGDDEFEMQESLMYIYPNPANDKLTIEFDHNGNYALMVYDNLGNSVLRERMIFDSEKEILDISALSPGIYFVSISSEANVFTRKIVVE